MPLNSTGKLSLGGGVVGESVNLEIRLAATSANSMDSDDNNILTGKYTGPWVFPDDWRGKSWLNENVTGPVIMEFNTSMTITITGGARSTVFSYSGFDEGAGTLNNSGGFSLIINSGAVGLHSLAFTFVRSGNVRNFSFNSYNEQVTSTLYTIPAFNSHSIGITGGAPSTAFSYSGERTGSGTLDASGNFTLGNLQYSLGTTAYTGSTASNPWRTGIVAGTSGYYVRNVGVSGGSNYIIGYAVVVDGTIIYQSNVPTAGNYIAPPPAQIAKTTLVGYSYFVTIPQPNNNVWGLPTDQDLYELVECFNFEYTAVSPGTKTYNFYFAATNASRSLSVDVTALPIVPIYTPTITLQDSFVGTQVISWSVASGPPNGTYSYEFRDVPGVYTSGTGTLNASGAATISTELGPPEDTNSFQLTVTFFNSSGTQTNVVTDSISWSAPVPTYSVTTATSSVNEGGSITFTVNTTNVANGTNLSWAVSSFSDFTEPTGTFAINNNTGQFALTATADATTEGAETFTVNIYAGMTLVGTFGNSTTINDTSTTPAPTPTYAFGAYSTSVNEGGTVTFVVNTTNVANGTNLSWAVSRFSDIDEPTGTFSISSNTGTFALTATADATTEGSETFTVNIYAGITLVLTSNAITINDTSTTPAPSYPAAGTVLSQGCVAGTYTYRVTKADGSGGSYNEDTANSATCGYVAPVTYNPTITLQDSYVGTQTISWSVAGGPPNGTYNYQFTDPAGIYASDTGNLNASGAATISNQLGMPEPPATGLQLSVSFFNSSGTQTNVVTDSISWTAPAPSYPAAGTILSQGCVSGTYTYRVTKADGSGGSYNEDTPNSATCGYVAPSLNRYDANNYWVMQIDPQVDFGTNSYSGVAYAYWDGASVTTISFSTGSLAQPDFLIGEWAGGIGGEYEVGAYVTDSAALGGYVYRIIKQ
jgi:hypothetical protein